MNRDEINRHGWRQFRCECGAGWSIPTRDRFSPSAEDCPICREVMHSIGHEPDAALVVDRLKNLVNPPPRRCA